MPGVGEPWIPGKSLDALERRLAERAVATAEQAEPHLWGPERADWLAILDAEYGGIIVALRWAIEAKERDIALAISSALWPYWQARGKVAEGRELAESALALQTSGRLVVDARALHGAGVLALLEGDRVTAESRLGRARDLWIELDEPAWLGRCLNSLCVIAYRDGDLRTARDHARQATGILRKYGGRGALVRVLKDAALIEIADDDLDRAEELLTEAREIARDERNVAAEARILGNLSTVAQNRERWDHARELSEKAITMLAAEDDLEGVAFGLRGLGYICTSLGDLESAGTYFDDAIQLSTVLGNRWAVGETLRYKARLAIRAGHPAQAATLLASSMALFEETGDAAGSADVQSELAAIGPTNQD